MLGVLRMTVVEHFYLGGARVRDVGIVGNTTWSFSIILLLIEDLKDMCSFFLSYFLVFLVLLA